MGWLVWCILILIFLGLLTSWWLVLILIVVCLLVVVFTISFSDAHMDSRVRGPRDNNSYDDLAAYDDFIASMDDEG